MTLGIIISCLLFPQPANLVNHPEEDKYKHINLSNTNFQAKVFQVPGGEELMYALGYVRDGAALVFRTTDTSAAQKIIAILQPQVKAVEAEQV